MPRDPAGERQREHREGKVGVSCIYQCHCQVEVHRQLRTAVFIEVRY